MSGLQRINGFHVFSRVVHADDRGMFSEIVRNETITETLGRSFVVKQVSVSHSHSGVLRGLHLTDVPPGQAKLLSCLSGRFIEVVVDLRIGSPTFGRHEATNMSADEPVSIFIAEGLAHGYLALEDNSSMLYLHSSVYAPRHDHEIDALDPDLAIAWPLDSRQLRRSAKDTAAMTVREAAAAGILPRYENCADAGAPPTPRTA